MSEEQLRDEAHERWRETLELLGISPGSEAPAEKPAAPAPEPAFREPAPLYPSVETFESELPSEASGHREESTLASAPLNEQEAAESFEEVLPLETEAVEPFREQPRDLEEDPRSRGRRRGRRGGRSRSQRSAEDSRRRRDESSRETDGELEQEERAQDDENLSRGGGRDVDEESLEPEAQNVIDEEHEDELEEVTAETPEEPEEEPDTLSDWNVPSWQELISSLYRPDR